MTMNDTWGYKKHDANWKSSTDLIRKLVDIASKGGNFLLNVGPTGEGEIPEASVERLAAMGAWMKVNNRAVYGTQANPFPEPPAWGRVTRARNEDGSDRLYLCVFEWPKDGRLRLSGLLSEPRAVQILGQRTRNLWPSEHEGDAVVFALPKEPLDPACTVVAVDLAEPLQVATLPVISAADDLFVGQMMVAVGQMGDSKVTYRYTIDGSEPDATSTLAGRPFTIKSTTTVKARGFVDAKPVTRTVERTFSALVPIRAVQTLKADPGLSCTAFEVPDSIKNCGGITAGKQVRHGIVDQPGLALKPREENFGLVFTGFIQVPSSGLYRFFVDSDDGSTMSIHGNVVVDNDGLHSATERSGAIALEQGLHPIEIRMFEAAGQDLLRVSWIAPGATRKIPVPANAWKN